jgi:hypothetical protein
VWLVFVFCLWLLLAFALAGVRVLIAVGNEHPNICVFYVV